MCCYVLLLLLLFSREKNVNNCMLCVCSVTVSHK